MKNKLSDLRNHLFEVLEALKDQEHPMEIERAKTISGVAQTLINSAKLELQLIELVGGSEHGEFFDQPRLPRLTAPAPE